MDSQQLDDLSSRDDPRPGKSTSPDADGNHGDGAGNSEDNGGLGTGRAVLLIAGGVAGTGLIALPHSLKQAGWTALVMMFVCLVAAGYCGVLLGRCWSMLLERYPESRGHVRRPYPLIAEKAVGRWMGVAVTVAIAICNFGVCVVNVLLVAENTQSLLQEAGVHVSLCYWLIVACVIITPVTWLDTPKDFWWVGIGGTLTVTVTFVLAFIVMSMEAADGRKGLPETNPSASGVFLAFGTILYAATGSSYFPTIQHDMKNPGNFTRAVVYAFTVTMLMYLPLSIFGYYLYGRDLHSNVLFNLPDRGLKKGAEVAISAHAFFSIWINLNPVTQSWEDVVDAGKGLTWKRCLLRTGTVLVILLVAESIPRFGPLLDLIGSAFAFLTLIAPCLFYLALCSQQGHWTDRSLPLHIKVLCIEIALVGVLAGCAATYSALVEIVSPNTFVLPCFVSTDLAPKGRDMTT